MTYIFSKNFVHLHLSLWYHADETSPSHQNETRVQVQRTSLLVRVANHDTRYVRSVTNIIHGIIIRHRVFVWPFSVADKIITTNDLVARAVSPAELLGI